MNTQSIHELVQQRAGCESPDVAENCTHAVLTVLSQRNLGGEGQNLAAQLPDDLATILTNPSGDQERFNADEFVRRVAQQLDVTEELARTRTHAVLSAIADAVSGGERTDFLAALPEDLNGYAVWNRP